MYVAAAELLSNKKPSIYIIPKPQLLYIHKAFHSYTYALQSKFTLLYLLVNGQTI